MQGSDLDETKASARLPLFDIEIMHRRSRASGAEQVSVTLRPLPAIAAFGELVATTNRFWAEFAQMMWAPWLAALRDPLRQDFPGVPPARTTPRLPEPPSPAQASTAKRRPSGR